MRTHPRQTKPARVGGRHFQPYPQPPGRRGGAETEFGCPGQYLIDYACDGTSTRAPAGPWWLGSFGFDDHIDVLGKCKIQRGCGNPAPSHPGACSRQLSHLAAPEMRVLYDKPGNTSVSWVLWVVLVNSLTWGGDWGDSWIYSYLGRV